MFFTYPMPAAVFCFTVGFLSSESLAISPLRFPVIVPPSRYPAFVTAVRLPPPASTTDTEPKTTPAATKRN
jgi:hypothetical protein